MHRVVVVLGVLGALGCGSGASLNPAFGRTWDGTVRLSVPELGVFTYAGHLPITVSGETATADGLCRGSSGSITFTGSGNSASWRGNMSCPPMPQPGQDCALTFTFQSASVSLGPDGKGLTATGAGTVAGCGFDTTFSITFEGS